MDYLIDEYKRLENNLMNATEENVQNAIYGRMQKIANEIFTLSK